MRFAETVYAAVSRFPKEEQYVLATQVRRAVISIPSNIAEGFGRATKDDYLHFLVMARGSLFEVGTQVELSRRLGYLQEEQFLIISEMRSDLGRKLNAYIKSLKKSDHK